MSTKQYTDSMYHDRRVSIVDSEGNEVIPKIKDWYNGKGRKYTFELDTDKQYVRTVESPDSIFVHDIAFIGKQMVCTNAERDVYSYIDNSGFQHRFSRKYVESTYA